MNVIELVRQKGIEPRRVSTNKGGEYHSSCPICGDGGKGADSDRFHVWPEQNDGEGSWWCRQCDRGGDGIALLMAMDGKSYQEACAALGKEVKGPPPVPEKPRPARRGSQAKKQHGPGQYQIPQVVWRQHAEKLVSWAHKQLVDSHPEQMEKLGDRGLNSNTVLRWGLGWNPGKNNKPLFRSREAWGLDTVMKSDGKGGKRKKKLWIPRGLVIPYRRDGVLQRVRIRRPAALLRTDLDKRYYVLPGSSAMPWLIGENRKAYVVVETELDGLLIDQEAGDLAGVLALGSASNMPDEYCHPHINNAVVVLNALDYDQAGGKASRKWRSAYPNSKRWPAPDGKDPGDAYKSGVDIYEWILAGLPPAWHVGLSPYIRKGMQVVPADQQQVEKTPEPLGSDLPENVRELGELLRRYPITIINTIERTGVQAPGDINNQDAVNLASDLVYGDTDCIEYLNQHPDDRIDGRNFFNV